MRKILMCAVWFLVIYFGVLIAGAAIVGTVAELNNPENAYQAGYEAGLQFAADYRGIVMIIASFISIVGSFVGLLPGTRKKEGSKPYHYV